MAEIRYFICDKCESDGREKGNKLHSIRLSGSKSERIIHYCDRCIDRVSHEIPEIGFVVGRGKEEKK